MRYVSVSRRESGQRIRTYSIHVGSQNDLLHEAEYLSAAWQAAVSDRVVDGERPDDYDLKFEDDPGATAHGLSSRLPDS